MTFLGKFSFAFEYRIVLSDLSTERNWVCFNIVICYIKIKELRTQICPLFLFAKYRHSNLDKMQRLLVAFSMVRDAKCVCALILYKKWLRGWQIQVKLSYLEFWVSRKIISGGVSGCKFMLFKKPCHACFTCASTLNTQLLQMPYQTFTQCARW